MRYAGFGKICDCICDRIFEYNQHPYVGTLSKSTLIYRVLQKWHRVYGTIILQLYITESCRFQQNVPKEILYMTQITV